MRGRVAFFAEFVYNISRDACKTGDWYVYAPRVRQKDDMFAAFSTGRSYDPPRATKKHPKTVGEVCLFLGAFKIMNEEKKNKATLSPRKGSAPARPVRQAWEPVARLPATHAPQQNRKMAASAGD